jgi:hypothetical protein
MSKQIFSKIAKIGEEVRAAKVMKVEFANAAINSLIAGLKSQLGNLQQAKAESTKDFSDYENLKRKVVEQVKVNEGIVQNAADLGGRASQVMGQLENQLKDLGMNVNEFKPYGEIEKFRSELLDEAQAVSRLTKNTKGLI